MTTTFPWRPLSYYGTKTKLLGTGGYGKVYMYMSNETVAIKKCGHYAGLIDAPVLREIAAMVKLSHPNVIALRDVIIDNAGDRLFMVMEKALFDLLGYFELGFSRPCFKCSLTENSKYLSYQIISGVNYCLSKGIINADIKPQNVLIFPEGVVKICDFGLSRTIANTSNGNHEINYTLWYRPPECLLGGVCDDKSDIWALGCTLFEIYRSQNTSRKWEAFRGFSEAEILYYITSEFGNLEGVWPGITKLPRWKPIAVARRRSMFLSLGSPGAEGVIKNMLQIDPSNRTPLTSVLSLPYFDSVRSVADSGVTPSSETNEEGVIKILDENIKLVPVKQKTTHEHNNILIMLGWINDVIATFGLTPSIFFLVQNMVERYIIKNRIYTPKLQLYGLVALLVATQIINDPQPAIFDMVYVCDNTYTPSQFKEAYQDLCTVLEFDFLCTLPTHYLDLWLVSHPPKTKELVRALLHYLMTDQTFYRTYTPKEFALGCLSIVCEFEEVERGFDLDLNLEEKIKEFTKRFTSTNFKRDPNTDGDEEEWYDKENIFKNLGLVDGVASIQKVINEKTSRN